MTTLESGIEGGLDLNDFVRFELSPVSLVNQFGETFQYGEHQRFVYVLALSPNLGVDG